MGVVLAQPHRVGETSHLAGFVLGRLLLTHKIDPDQFAAGERYGQLAARHMRDVLGISYRWPAASIAGRIGGRDLGADPDPDSVIELERAWSDAMNCLANYGLLHRMWAVEPRKRLTARLNYGMREIHCPPMRLEA